MLIGADTPELSTRTARRERSSQPAETFPLPKGITSGLQETGNAVCELPPVVKSTG